MGFYCQDSYSFIPVWYLDFPIMYSTHSFSSRLYSGVSLVDLWKSQTWTGEHRTPGWLQTPCCFFGTDPACARIYLVPSQMS